MTTTDSHHGLAIRWASPEAQQWAKSYPSLADAWEHCPRADWMIWMLHSLGRRHELTVRRFACDQVRRLGHLLGERGRRAVEVAEQAVQGAVSDQVVEQAHRDARYTACEAARTNDAAGYALRAAAQLTERDPWAGSQEAVRFAALAAGGDAARTAQAEQLRALTGNPFHELDRRPERPNRSRA